MNCPCEKCIRYAICVASSEVWCTPFRKYANKINDKYFSDPEMYWDKVREILPNAIKVFGDKKDDITLGEIILDEEHRKGKWWPI